MTTSASDRRPRTSAAVPAKFENGTYDMNDESHTDESYPDSPIASSGRSGDVTASRQLTNGISELAKTTTKSVESTNHFTFSKDETETNKVSWSNSEGSTFDSESDQSGRGDSSTDFGYVEFKFADQKGNAGEACTSRTSTSESLPRLQHVDYFSEVQIASCTSDDISVVEFISKEATRSIFERRMVPLDVAARRKRLDDVSAFSSTKSASPPDGSYSMPPVRNRRVLSKENKPLSLENVNSRSTTLDFAKEDHRKFTTMYGLPRTVDAFPSELNGVPKRISATIVKDDDISIITLPKTMLEISLEHPLDTLSTLGNISARSESFGNFSLSYEENGSCEVSRQKVLTDTYNDGAYQKSEEAIEYDMVARTTNRRIKDLKERLRKLQEVSSLQPGLGHFESSRQSNNSSKNTSDVLMQQVSAKEAKICNTYNARLSKTKTSPHKTPPQASAYRKDAVPTEVSPALESNDDDLSTIACELHSDETKYNLFDVELGSQTSPHPKPSGLTFCFEEFKGKATLVFRIATQKTAWATARVSNTLQQFKIYQVIRRSWIINVQERPPTEKAIIAVISISCLVLFILLLSIVTA